MVNGHRPRLLAARGDVLARVVQLDRSLQVEPVFWGGAESCRDSDRHRCREPRRATAHDRVQVLIRDTARLGQFGYRDPFGAR